MLIKLAFSTLGRWGVDEQSQTELPPSCVLTAKGHALPPPGMTFVSSFHQHSGKS